MEKKDLYLDDQALGDLYFNPPTTMANEFVPIASILRDINKASADYAVKKVIEWGEEECPHAGPPDDDLIQHKKHCNACWNALKKLIET